MGSHVIIINTTTTCEKMADGDKNDLQTIADDLVVTKYKMAAEIVNKVLKELVEACKPDASVRDLRVLGDKRLTEETGKAFKKDKKLQKVAESFGCKPVEGMLSHQLEQNRIDGEKTIIQNPTEAQRKEHEKYDFELHEVYAVDVLIS